MHEIAIVDNLITVVDDQVKEHQLEKVHRVHLVVGQLTGVVEDVLRFCWQVSAEGTPWEGAQLTVDQKAAVALCADCNVEYELKEQCFACPHCGGAIKSLVTGKELYIDYIEGD
ncbi:hydrogenase maturation nickel metallochaperone HypA [Metallumcola ferriviriculae]|uniref:Hydrogenase maturation factor HypA n=1 Tax=Metallumcola ferriviriculae TaxID=3039180 RepID=A0AAU0UPC1_9FIRM|nr:hydrogenase maturation nickel metallochaperone HypA [Desulfitibacteraceae bacterium MK1]